MRMSLPELRAIPSASLWIAFLAVVSCVSLSTARPDDFGQWFVVPSYSTLGSFEGECGPGGLTVESPSCNVTKRADGYEFRRYEGAQMWATTVLVNETYDKAKVDGFYRCFYYIQGQNKQKVKIEMTAPVLVQPVPEALGFELSFFVPSRFTPENVPKPSDSKVRIIKAPAMTRAVLGPFGGFPNENVYKEKWAILKAMLDRDGVAYDDNTVGYAGYSSPFRVFNRKQEVWVKVFV